jgi:hypothetical protein
MRTLSFVFALGIAMGLALSVTPAEARPPSQYSLDVFLNGERVRPLDVDGGGLLLTTDSGLVSVPVTGGGVYVVENMSAAACHLCMGNKPEQATWDGGCSTTLSDPNYGSALAAGTSRVIVTQDTTTAIKALPPAAGGTCTSLVYRMR